MVAGTFTQPCTGSTSVPPKRPVQFLTTDTCEPNFTSEHIFLDFFLKKGSWEECIRDQGAPKSSDWCPYTKTHRKSSCEDRGGDWHDAVTSQGMPGATRSWRKQEGNPASSQLTCPDCGRDSVRPPSKISHPGPGPSPRRGPWQQVPSP